MNIQNKLNILFLLFHLLLRVSPLIGQEKYLISGNIKDTNSVPVYFANVIIFDSQNENLITGTSSDYNGYFEFNLSPGLYYIKISSLGYKSWEQKITLNQDKVLKDIILEDEQNALDEIVIRSKRELVKRDDDKIIMNLENNEFIKGKNLTDILKYAPNVWVDPGNNRIMLKGMDATIFINDKKSNLSSQDLMSYLNSLTDEELKSVEIISNPSSKYDAEGLGGIININIKKKNEKGISGSLNSRTNFAKLISYNTALMLNTRFTEKLFLNSYFVYQENENLSHEFRNERITSPFTNYNYQKIDTSLSTNAFISFELSYDIDDRNEFQLQFRNLNSDRRRLQNNDLIISDNTEIFSKGNYNYNTNYNYKAYGLNYKLKIDTVGQEIKLIADYFNSNSDTENNYENLFYSENDVLVDDNYRRSISPTSFDIFSAQLDYHIPKKKAQFELGLKYSDVDNFSSILFEELINGRYVKDFNFSNFFNYSESIYAGYLSYKINKLFNEKSSIKFGLRGEYTNGKGELPETKIYFSKKYFDLFPSLFITYDLNKNRSFSWSYSRRINRPNYQFFNPTIFYLTDFTSQVGNPDIDPSYTNSYELNYNSSDFNLLLYYNNINGEPREILTQLSDTELRYQWRNIDKTKIYGISLSYNAKIKDWWSIFLNSYWYYKNYSSSFEDAVDNINTSKGTIQGRIASQFKLPFKINSEISFEYNGPETYGQFESGENYAFYLNVSKKIENIFFFNLKVVDPFNKLRYIFKNNQSFVQTFQLRNNFNRAVQISFRYSFDSGKKTKRIRMDNSVQDLRNRTN